MTILITHYNTKTHKSTYKNLNRSENVGLSKIYSDFLAYYIAQDAQKKLICPLPNKTPDAYTQYTSDKTPLLHRTLLNTTRNTRLKLTLISYTIDDLIHSTRMIERCFSDLGHQLIQLSTTSSMYPVNNHKSHIPVRLFKTNSASDCFTMANNGLHNTVHDKTLSKLQTNGPLCYGTNGPSIGLFSMGICHLNLGYQNIPQTTKLFTVTRASFVFKKTREQFGLSKKAYVSSIPITSKIQQQVLLQLLNLLKLPVELKIQVNH
jgi:hypothetical protein